MDSVKTLDRWGATRVITTGFLREYLFVTWKTGRSELMADLFTGV